MNARNLPVDCAYLESRTLVKSERESRSNGLAKLPITGRRGNPVLIRDIGVASRRSAQRDSRQLRRTTEPKREAGPQTSPVVHVERHSIDVVPA
jgi:hypothetical protein